MNKQSISKPIRNQRGQTLIEYIIIVALVGVGSIALMKAVGNQVNVNFGRTIKALGGDVQGDLTPAQLAAGATKAKDMKNFASGALNKNTNKNQGNESNSAE